MSIEQICDSASSVMTVISFLTFSGILAWAFWRHSERDFAVAAALPFADEENSDV